MEEYNLNEPLISNKDIENNEAQIDLMIDLNIRKGFIVKVYTILIFQILFTSLFVFCAYYSQSFYNLLINSLLIFFFSVTVLISSLIIVACNPEFLKKVPQNYIFLIAFTFAESYFVASMTCQFSQNSVMLALLFTFVVIVTLTIYSWKSENDITIYGGVLSCLLSCLILCAILLIFIQVPLIYMFNNTFALLLFATYIIYDTQLIVGNKTSIRYSTDDYILASMNLYLDIINIFIRILSAFGETR